jgi:hypothetical protein
MENATPEGLNGQVFAGIDWSWQQHGLHRRGRRQTG